MSPKSPPFGFAQAGFRLRMRIHEANPHASLRMTTWVDAGVNARSTSAAEAALSLDADVAPFDLLTLTQGRLNRALPGLSKASTRGEFPEAAGVRLRV